MRVFTHTCLALLIIGSLLATLSVSAEGADDMVSWQTIATGIEYSKYQTSEPNNIFVVRMDRANTDLTLESMVANGKLAEGRETVSGMYQRYDQALNFWGGRTNPPDWGMRNQAVVAINGSYFDWASGMPQGGQIQDGWYIKRFDNLGGRTGFGWKLDRSPFIGQCTYHRPEKQLVTYPATGNSQQITNINVARGTAELILYTPQYNTRSGTNNSGVEVIVEMARPTLTIPSPAYAAGYVRQIKVNQGNNLIPFNSIILSATGGPATTLQANVHVGDEIRISQEITPYLYNCETPDGSINWTKTYTSIQGDYQFLMNGTIQDYTDEGAITRNPRTAIAYNDQYVFFIVVDGRDTTHSIGMTIHQLAQFTKDTLGATSGVAQDGGGSSTLVINGMVVNNTFCNNYTCSGPNKVFLPMIRRGDQASQPNNETEVDIVSSAAGIERAVANGMLMVIAKPGAYSSSFSTGNQVTASSAVDLRLGPGTNYDSFTTVPIGTKGTILDQLNGLDGVMAKSSYWWYVNFGGLTGWVPQEALVK